MKKLLLFVFILSVSIVSAQKTIKINIQENNTTKSIQNEKILSIDKFNIKESIYSIDVVSQNSKQGEYVQLQVEGLQKTFNAGNPELPVYAKLIEIPLGSKVEFNVLSFDEKEIQLGEHGINTKIIPAQESVSKSSDPDKIPFKLNKEIYSNNSFFKSEFIQFEDQGYLRNKHLGYIQISPFEYNPISNTLKIKYNFDIEIKFVSDNKSVNINKKHLQSPYFENLPIQTINTVSDSKALISAPVKYVIVSPRTFEATLQPFIEWKKLIGFNVVEAYTDVIGTTTTSIKAYLEDLYENPTDGVSPTFVLLVGDVAQIPAYNNQVAGDSHVTDLYYFEYTGDYLPEVFYGRFSATTIEQLQSQIDKTLQVEQYTMPNKDYLNNVVLIAGADASMAPTYGNGFVNYATANYINSTNGYNAIPYLYPASASSDVQIRTDISNGVALANYTAHCSNDGWSDPTFSIANIATMTNQDMYPLMIGNCCQSVKFEGSSFGEEILRAVNKGAVGYIGASDFSYWDEDYYWAIGNRSSITANPTYDATNLGAYDKFFHTNGEARTDWYITQGQMNVAGNIAVQASTSSRKAYYWEIYHLMGDPSLTPFVKIPTTLTASYNSEIIVGSTTYEVNTEEDAFVALSLNGTLLDVQLAGAGGVVNLSFASISDVGTADLVITKQNRIPVIAQINIKPASTPYITKDIVEINDAVGNNNGTLEYGETANLNVQLKNVSETFDAFEVNAKLMTTDTNLQIIDSDEVYGTIESDTVSLINDAFQVEVETDIVDQTQVELTLQVTGKDVSDNPYTWNSKVYFTLNAPKIEIGELIVDDSSGDNNGIIDPGETATLQLEVKNTGHASIVGLTGLLEYVSGSTHFNIIDGTVDAFSISAGSTETIEFNVSVAAEEVVGTPVQLKFSIIDNNYSFYSVNENNSLTIGEIPEFLISDGSTHTINVNNSLFYDSGSKLSNYTDDELYTITFLPKNVNGNLKVTFNSFSVEENGSGCYDILSIYDGENTSATKIGDYCSSNIPTEIVASSTSGALTFKFDSDGSVNESGWEAEITNVDVYAVTFNINDNTTTSPLQDVKVIFNSTTLYTNSSGVVVFSGVEPKTDLIYEVSKSGYTSITDTIDVTNEDVAINLSLSVITAVDDIRFEDLMVYPNPSQGLIYIDFGTSRNENMNINVYDVLGRSIFNKSIISNDNNKETINLSNQPKGIYFVTIQKDSGEKISKKIILK